MPASLTTSGVRPWGGSQLCGSGTAEKFSNSIYGGCSYANKGRKLALGWNAAANYAFDSKNEIGLVYRSKVTHSMEADFKAYMVNGMSIKRDAYGKVTLPDSWAIGYNHNLMTVLG